MVFGIDMHYHGPEEWLGTERWNARNIARLVRHNLHALAITEMGPEDLRFYELKKAALRDAELIVDKDQIYVPESDVLLFRTLEIPARASDGKQEGHVLIVGAKEKIPIRSLDYILDAAKEQGAAVIADHAFAGPFSFMVGVGYARVENAFRRYFEERRIHALEYNGQMDSLSFLNSLFRLANANKRAEAFAKLNNLNLVANTDGHSAREAARSYTTLDINPEKLGWTNYISAVVNYLKCGQRTIPIKIAGPAFAAERHMMALIPVILNSKLGFHLKDRYHYCS